MIEIDDKIVSADLLRECFACDLAQCKGICCVEGNAGAPLEADEVEILRREYPNYRPCMTPEGIEAVERQGFMVVDDDGDLTTPLVDGAQCAYACEEHGVTLCAIEKAWREGRTSFRKPIVPPLSDPPDALLERNRRAELPPLVGVRPGPEVRGEAGDPGLQGPARTDHPPLRRGVLPRPRGRRRADEGLKIKMEQLNRTKQKEQ